MHTRPPVHAGLCHALYPTLVCADCGIPLLIPRTGRSRNFYGACTACWEELLEYYDVLYKPRSQIQVAQTNAEHCLV